ncbi:MAG: isoprenylcysteine carboxylmethyltransferase family protein [Acidimicrobiales bacterium]
MGLLTADDPTDTAIAWLFVGVQFALLVVILLLPPGDAWPVPAWLDLVARILQWIGAAILLVGIVNLGRSLTPLPTPVPHGELRTSGLFRLVRHPIYTGVMALALGTALRLANPWAMARRARPRRLVHGEGPVGGAAPGRPLPDYAAYAATTPRFVPFLPPPRR